MDLNPVLSDFKAKRCPSQEGQRERNCVHMGTQTKHKVPYENKTLILQESITATSAPTTSPAQQLF